MMQCSRGRAWVAAFALALGACGTGSGATLARARPEDFDGARAWKHLESLVAIGPRQSGTLGGETARAYIEQELRAAGCEPVREPFKAATPIGDLDFANVYVDLPGRPRGTGPASLILICTHFDTKRFPFTFVGANDGGSGTAVVIELARVLRAQPPGAYGYRLLLLDGEEAVREQWADPDNRYGSKHHAQGLKDRGELAHIAGCVLLDMVGDSDLHLERESYSDARMLEAFINAGRALELAQCVPSGAGQPIKDDHLSFLEMDLPSVDLIDFDYGPGNAYWHRPEDTLEHCSKDSLSAIGRIVLAGLPALETYLQSRGR